MSTTTHVPAATFTAPRHAKYLGPKARAAGYRADAFTVAEIVDMIHASVDGYVVLWQSFGHVRGIEGFGRNVFTLTTNPHAEGGIDIVLASGNRVISYGVDRTLRLLTTAA